MMSSSENRQLAAIMFTDIVGFTKMMDEDELRTREILDSQREIVYPIVEKFGGSVLKEMGDGMLIMFGSAKNAVKCALEVQNLKKNFTLRIGIHIGDVIFEKGDVLGSGVNIAARVESLAPPGSICITSDVWNQISNQTGLNVESLGVKHLKGVNEPIKIYEVIPESAKKNKRRNVLQKTTGSKVSYQTKSQDSLGSKKRVKLYIGSVITILIIALVYSNFLTANTKHDYGKSVAVLPLQNLSPNPDDAFFTDGVHEDIITQLTKIKDLKVIGRSSVISYSTENRNIKNIAGELGVNTVMEGSVRRLGERIRVAVQLIDVNDNVAIWAETFERDLDDLFNIQSEIAYEIASALQITIRPSEIEQIDRQPTDDPLAYDYYLRAREYESRPGYIIENMQIAEELYKRAINQDPGFALAYARLSILNSTLYWFKADYSEQRVRQILTNAEYALSLVPDMSEGLYALGLYYYWVEKDYEKALEKLDIALNLQPNNSDMMITIGAVQRRMGLWEESLANMLKSIELNPRIPSDMYQIALSYAYLREFDKAILWTNRALEIAPDFYIAEVGKYTSQLMISGDLDEYRKNLTNLSYMEHTNPDIWWYHNLIGRNFDYLLRLTESTDFEVFESQDAYHPKEYIMGLLHSIRENKEAELYLNITLEHLKVKLEQDENDSRVHATLGKTYALLKMEDEATYHAEKLLELMPETADYLLHSSALTNTTLIYSLLGDVEKSVELLEKLLNRPSMINVNYLKVFFYFDFIRDTPEFENLINSYEKNTVTQLI